MITTALCVFFMLTTLGLGTKLALDRAYEPHCVIRLRNGKKLIVQPSMFLDDKIFVYDPNTSVGQFVSISDDE